MDVNESAWKDIPNLNYGKKKTPSVKTEVSIKCLYCGTIFVGKRNRKYCTRNCLEKSNVNSSRLSKYGISSDQYETMYKTQQGLCAICNQPYANLVIDHCHTTGKVRQLLCNNCNILLGRVESYRGVDILNDLLSYIRKHS